MERLVLRLHDLPLGYFPLDFSEGGGSELICEPLDPPEPPAALASFIRRFLPEGCLGTYLRAYRVPGSAPSAQLVGTGALDAGSLRGAKAGFAVAPQILSQITEGETPKEVATAPAVGDATRLFHWLRVPSILGKGHRPGSFLVWRSGNVLATVLASAGSLEASDRVAEELARRQLAHIEHPTPYTRTERNASEVGLDDPAIDIPVYWLGRTFRPGGALPANRLFESGFSGEARPEEPVDMGSAEAPQAPLAVNYRNIWLDTWTTDTWHVFANSATAKAITSWKCTQTRTVTIPGGSATIFGGYKEDYARCPKKAPSAFTAWVDVGGVKIVVNSPPAPDFIETVNPYGSFKGMEAIVAALKERPKRQY